MVHRLRRYRPKELARPRTTEVNMLRGRVYGEAAGSYRTGIVEDRVRDVSSLGFSYGREIGFGPEEFYDALREGENLDRQHKSAYMSYYFCGGGTCRFRKR